MTVTRGRWTGLFAWTRVRGLRALEFEPTKEAIDHGVGGVRRR